MGKLMRRRSVTFEEVRRAFLTLLFFGVGMAFLGVAVFSGFDPQRALAGGALVYLAKIV